MFVNPEAQVCEDFLKGYCAEGLKCKKKHTFICQEFLKKGVCSKADQCKLQHPRRKRKNEEQEEQEAKKPRTEEEEAQEDEEEGNTSSSSSFQNFEDQDDLIEFDSSPHSRENE